MFTSSRCSSCHKPSAHLLRCTCGIEAYCDKACQRKAWNQHKSIVHNDTQRFQEFDLAVAVVQQRIPVVLQESDAVNVLLKLLQEYRACRINLGYFVVNWISIAVQHPKAAAHLMQQLVFLVPVEAHAYVWEVWDGQRDWSRRGVDALPFACDGASIARNLLVLIEQLEQHRKRSDPENIVTASLLADLLIAFDSLLTVTHDDKQIQLKDAKNDDIQGMFISAFNTWQGKQALQRMSALVGQLDGDDYFPDFSNYLLQKLDYLEAHRSDFDDSRVFIPSSTPEDRVRMLKPTWT